MPDALRQIRQDLGERAVILETRRSRTGLLGLTGAERVHVLAAVEEKAAPQSQLNVDALRNLMAPREDARAQMAERLSDGGIEPALRERLLGACAPNYSAERVATEIAAGLRVAEPEAPANTQARIALVGPTGVGKTTTTAKLAARYALSGKKRVAMVTMDTYRIGAVEQIRIYARVMGLPLEVAESPEEMRAAVARHADKDVILIDTVGRSPNKSLQLAEIQTFLNAANVTETHLVLAATSAPDYLARVTDQFACLQPNRLIVTKLDEMPRWGAIASLCHRTGLHASFVTDGQEVPRNLRPADPAEIAVKALGGHA